MGFNGVCKGLILCTLRAVDNELTCINHGFLNNPYPANVENMVSS
jgi:hypothetical protein